MSEFSNINYFVNAMPGFAYFSAEMFMRNIAGLDQPSYKGWIISVVWEKMKEGERERKQNWHQEGRRKVLMLGKGWLFCEYNAWTSECI